jgi:hypothetical protein
MRHGPYKTMSKKTLQWCYILQNENYLLRIYFVFSSACTYCTSDAKGVALLCDSHVLISHLQVLIIGTHVAQYDSSLVSLFSMLAISPVFYQDIRAAPNFFHKKPSTME